MQGRTTFLGMLLLTVSFPSLLAAQGSNSTGTWRSAGTGDCPGHSLGDTSGPNPYASRCDASMNGYTAVCWSGNCNYKDIATASCTGGASPGRMYTCAAVSK